MVDSMKGVVCGALLSLLVWNADLPAQRRAAPPAPHKHPVSGFTLRLPPGWTAEDGPVQTLVLPPGVKVDPEREDNPEIYVVEIHPGITDPEDEALVKDVRDRFVYSGIGLEQSEEKTTFVTPGGLGVSYMWEFKNPRNNIIYRARLYAVKTKGHVVTLMAQGERGKMGPREKQLLQIATTLDAPAIVAARPAAPVAAAAAKPQPAPTQPQPAPKPQAAVEAAAPPSASPISAPKPEPVSEAPALIEDKADDSPLARLWVARLYGRILSLPGQTTGPLQGRVILRRDETWSSISAPTLEAIDQAPPAGRWRVITRGAQPFLVLKPESGDASAFELKTIGGKIYLGNQPAVLEDPR